jgi:hypothetical protein
MLCQLVETEYIWLIYYNKIKDGYGSDGIKKFTLPDNKDNIYTVVISNFGTHSKFNLRGWYMYVYNNINNSYTLPMTKITNPGNMVNAYVAPYLLGKPFSFNYVTSVEVRVNSTFVDTSPDFVMDSLPPLNKFWKDWFSMIK